MSVFRAVTCANVDGLGMMQAINRLQGGQDALPPGNIHGGYEVYAEHVVIACLPVDGGMCQCE